MACAGGSPAPLLPAKRATPSAKSQFAEVWTRLINLGLTPGYIDLGQGKPEFAPAPAAVSVARGVLGEPLPAPSQYSPVPGSQQLMEAVRAYTERRFGAAAAPKPGECVITTSATEGLFCSFFGCLEPGDEVIVPQPAFPWYVPQLQLAGCTPVPVYLKAEDGFRISKAALSAAVTPRTKAVIINTPHNPTGHVFTEEELREVAAVCCEHNLLAFADEVYERQTWGGHQHRRLADIEGMRERTLTLSSGGKLFCCTGWRVGWILGPSQLIAGISRVHSFTSYCAPTPLQLGVAAALSDATLDPAEEPFTKLLVANAGILTGALESCGVKVIAPQGGYFLVADTSPLGIDAEQFCDRLADEAKVVAVPLACFYSDNPDPNTVRFTLCKTTEMIEEAAGRIRSALGAKRPRRAE